MAIHDMSKSHQEPMPLLSGGAQITANAAEGGRSRLAAERSRDLLLHFDHAQIPFRQIIRQRHARIRDEGEHRCGMVEQGIQQVFGGRLFGTTAPFGDGRMGGKAPVEDRPIAPPPVLLLPRLGLDPVMWRGGRAKWYIQGNKE